MGSADGWREQVRTRARTGADAEVIIGLVERLRRELGVVPRAAPGQNQSSLGLLPPGASKGRIGAITIGSGRLYAHFDAAVIEAHHRELVGTEVAERVWLTTYVRGRTDEERAVEMIRRALAASVAPAPSEKSSTTSARPRRTVGPVGPGPEHRAVLERAGTPSEADAASPVQSTVRGQLPPPSDRAMSRAAQVVSSERYRSAAELRGSRAPDPDRVVQVLAALIDASAPITFQRAADVAEIDVARVPGLLTMIYQLLTVDGVSALAVDRSSQELRLDRPQLNQAFPSD